MAPPTRLASAPDEFLEREARLLELARCWFPTAHSFGEVTGGQNAGALKVYGPGRTILGYVPVEKVTTWLASSRPSRQGAREETRRAVEQWIERVPAVRDDPGYPSLALALTRTTTSRRPPERRPGGNPRRAARRTRAGASRDGPDDPDLESGARYSASRPDLQVHAGRVLCHSKSTALEAEPVVCEVPQDQTDQLSLLASSDGRAVSTCSHEGAICFGCGWNSTWGELPF
jgi:hypothetical protein